MAVPILGRGATPKLPDDSKAGTISATFPDDHTIDGLQLKVENVTAEQIAVVVFYLQRVAMSMVDAAMYAARQQQAEIEAVGREIAASRRKAD